MTMPNEEIVVIDSGDNEFEFEWEPDKEFNWEPDKAHDKVNVPDALTSYHCPI